MEAWREVSDRARALALEAACRRADGGAVDATWLSSACAWLAEVTPPWQQVAGVPATRAYRSIASSPDLEVWAIAWPSGGRLELHDHGGAAGSLRVVDGALVEQIGLAGATTADGGRRLRGALRTRTVTAGRGSAFGPDHVHDVVNLASALATSVHVYSAAERPMAFYRAVGRQLVARPGVADAAAVVEGAGVVDGVGLPG